MPVGKDLVKWALRRMGFQLTRLGSPAAAPSPVAAVAVPRGSTASALSQVNAVIVRREGALRRHHYSGTREQREKQDRQPAAIRKQIG